MTPGAATRPGRDEKEIARQVVNGWIDPAAELFTALAEAEQISALVELDLPLADFAPLDVLPADALPSTKAGAMRRRMTTGDQGAGSFGPMPWRANAARPSTVLTPPGRSDRRAATPTGDQPPGRAAKAVRLVFPPQGQSRRETNAIGTTAGPKKTAVMPGPTAANVLERNTIAGSVPEFCSREGSAEVSSAASTASAEAAGALAPRKDVKQVEEQPSARTLFGERLISPVVGARAPANDADASFAAEARRPSPLGEFRQTETRRESGLEPNTPPKTGEQAPPENIVSSFAAITRYPSLLDELSHDKARWEAGSASALSESSAPLVQELTQAAAQLDALLGERSDVGRADVSFFEADLQARSPASFFADSPPAALSDAPAMAAAFENAGSSPSVETERREPGRPSEMQMAGEAMSLLGALADELLAAPRGAMPRRLIAPPPAAEVFAAAPFDDREPGTRQEPPPAVGAPQSARSAPPVRPAVIHAPPDALAPNSTEAAAPDADALASLVNEVLVRQARRHGVDLS